MAQPNTPHSLSLKVLRLSRPALATQTPLPTTQTDTNTIPPAASLAYPSADVTSTNPLTPLLTLPASFGAAYVGETFSCTLCVNNDIIPPSTSSSPSTQPNKTVTAIRIAAELQTPSTSNTAGIPLELTTSPDAAETSQVDQQAPPPGSTLQRTLAYDLKEAGPHVLAVTVSYTETLRGVEGEGASGGRARTFRKLYQFVAQPVLAVRSKVSSLAGGAGTSGLAAGRRWVLEAQLENVGEGSVVVERVWLNGGEGVGWKGGVGGGDGDAQGEGDGKGSVQSVVLKPRDVEQVMFVVEEEKNSKVGSARQLAQVEIDWRSGMGEKGRLTTGWLAAKG